MELDLVEKTRADFMKMSTECFDKIIEESNKGIDRCIAIIREYNREWNKKVKLNSLLKKDAITIYFKEKLLEMDFDKQIKSALKYL